MDFPRNQLGNIETDDFYIPCQKGAMIYHYGRDVLAVFIPSIIKGRRLLKMCEEENIWTYFVIEGENELSFRFKAKDIDFIADYLKAKTIGKDVRPFSTKNLPKSDYTIPNEDLQNYRAVVSIVQPNDILIISKVTNAFLYERMQKRYKHIDIKKDIKKRRMARQIKEYIHSMGEWDNYLKFLEKNISKYIEEKKDELL